MTGSTSSRPYYAEKGFASQAEWFTLCHQVRVDTPERQRLFEEWLNRDGTKEGLLLILAAQDVADRRDQPR